MIFYFLYFAFSYLPDQTLTTSLLEIFDITNGNRSVVATFDYLIEAPNWTPDGKYLVFNSGGHLYKLLLSDPKNITLINTGTADTLNNDHVITIDGYEIGISHQPKEDGVSRVYRLNLTGGEPFRVTPTGPSYFHGWSMDKQIMAFCGARNNSAGALQFDVYTISRNGGKETQLTNTTTLDDGPEFAPDGEHIWFNSVRTGLMQAWRMKIDGSEQTQMTFDEDRNSWFPHVSPDNKKVVFISYHKGDLAPGEHLPYYNVELRLIGAEGGTPKTLVKLFGGQGTINVNSWSPDSKKFAFVSYLRHN